MFMNDARPRLATVAKGVLVNLYLRPAHQDVKANLGVQ